MLAIETEQLTKDYAVGFWRPRPYRALDSLSLQVEPNEVFGFLGPNGAGKTTTLKLLTELIYPTSGRISVLGKPPGHPDVRRRVGYLPEAPYFYDYLSAEELLTYFAGLFGLRGEPSGAVASRASSTGWASPANGGCRCASSRRACSSASAWRRPSSTNPNWSSSTSRCRASIRSAGATSGRSSCELRDRGCTVFFSSHILSDAEALCSRVAIVVGGQLVTSGRLSEILAFEVSGWELVMADLAAGGPRGARNGRAQGDADQRGPVRHRSDARGRTGTDRGRAAASRGGRFVSLNPVRTTLEDYFVQQVEARKAAPPAGRAMPEG